LTQRFPAQLQRLVVSPNLITNGGLEFDILNGGFDWRVIPRNGAVVGLDSDGAFEGSRALRITFDGSRNIEYGHVLQYVPFKRTHGKRDLGIDVHRRRLPVMSAYLR